MSEKKISQDNNTKQLKRYYNITPSPPPLRPLSYYLTPTHATLHLYCEGVGGQQLSCQREATPHTGFLFFYYSILLLCCNILLLVSFVDVHPLRIKTSSSPHERRPVSRVSFLFEKKKTRDFKFISIPIDQSRHQMTCCWSSSLAKLRLFFLDRTKTSLMNDGHKRQKYRRKNNKKKTKKKKRVRNFKINNNIGIFLRGELLH